MKLERLNSNSKFEALKKDELVSMITIFGGERLWTIKGGGTEYNDCWNNESGDDIHCKDGSDYDNCSGGGSNSGGSGSSSGSGAG